MSLSLWERVREAAGCPLSVIFVLTNRCNLRCPHCYCPKPETDELSTGEVSQLLQQMKDAGVFRVTFTGGEPLLREDLLELVAEAHRLRFIIHLKTNGTRIVDGMAARLRDLGLTSMDVSLYSVNKDAHDRFVGAEGSFDAAVNAADAFWAAGGDVQVNMTIMNWNAREVPLMLDLCAAHGWKGGIDGRMTATQQGDAAPLQYQASLDTLAPAIEAQLHRGILSLDGMASCIRSGEEQVCSAGIEAVVILPDGEVWPCLTLPWSMGNVRHTPFRNIVVNSPVVERIRNIRWADSPACVTCDVAGLCNRCPAEAFRAHGDEKGFTPTDCLLAEARARAMGLPRDRGR